MTRTEALRIAKPILFNTEMVRAIMDGRKTQTRRVIKPHNPIKAASEEYHQGEGLWIEHNSDDETLYIKDYSVSPCWFRVSDYIRKYALTSDILYVRETWMKTDVFGTQNSCLYKANTEQNETIFEVTGQEPKWRPSIHMPKEAARIFLRVTDVRAERVQDITAAECVREGIPQESLAEVGEDFTIGQFHDLWDSTINKSNLPLYGWNANPWVWVYSFERMEAEPDA